MPRATYRLQFNGEFGFAQATELVPYLAAAGVGRLLILDQQDRCAAPIAVRRPSGPIQSSSSRRRPLTRAMPALAHSARLGPPGRCIALIGNATALQIRAR